METRFILFREEPRWLEQAAAWFHQKWGVPQEAYRESMLACLAGESPVPQWYLAVEGERIVGGLGVIENDFHPRKDLAPNVCAVYVEEDRRCRGVAGRLLELACQDMAAQGVPTLYLLTDHTGFYERYGWEYLCPVRGDGEERDTRGYVRRALAGRGWHFVDRQIKRPPMAAFFIGWKAPGGSLPRPPEPPAGMPGRRPAGPPPPG